MPIGSSIEKPVSKKRTPRKNPEGSLVVKSKKETSPLVIHKEKIENVTPKGLALEDELPENQFDIYNETGLREIIGNPEGLSFEDITESIEKLVQQEKIEEVINFEPNLSDRQEEILRLKEEIENLHQEEAYSPKEKSTPWFSKITKWFSKKPEQPVSPSRRIINNFMDLKNNSKDPE